MTLHELLSLIPDNIISIKGNDFNGIYKVRGHTGYDMVVIPLTEPYGDKYPSVHLPYIASDNQLYNGTVVKVLAGNIRHFEELERFYHAIHCHPALCTESEMRYVHNLIAELPEGAKNLDTLKALYRVGPLDAGDLPSKAQRDWLMGRGYCAHIVVKGEDGYYACTGLGRDLYKLLEVYNDNTKQAIPGL